MHDMMIWLLLHQHNVCSTQTMFAADLSSFSEQKQIVLQKASPSYN